jgi:hypothetical protein
MPRLKAASRLPHIHQSHTSNNGNTSLETGGIRGNQPIRLRLEVSNRSNSNDDRESIEFVAKSIIL